MAYEFVTCVKFDLLSLQRKKKEKVKCKVNMLKAKFVIFLYILTGVSNKEGHIILWLMFIIHAYVTCIYIHLLCGLGLPLEDSLQPSKGQT